MVTAIAAPEPDESIQFIVINNEIIFPGNIDEFLEKNYKKFKRMVNISKNSTYNNNVN